MPFRNFTWLQQIVKWATKLFIRRQMNVQSVLVWEAKALWEILSLWGGRDGEEWESVSLFIPWSCLLPSFLNLGLVTPLLEDIYLMVAFTLLGTSFPLCHFVTHANSLPSFVFSLKKIWVYNDLLILKKKSRCRHKYVVVPTFAFSLQTTMWRTIIIELTRRAVAGKMAVGWGDREPPLGKKNTSSNGKKNSDLWNVKSGMHSYPSWFYCFFLWTCDENLSWIKHCQKQITKRNKVVFVPKKLLI